MPAEWAAAQMARYFPMNVNFMLNLSPNPRGKLDENLMREFARIGAMVRFPAELKEIPPRWMVRETTH